MQLNRPYGQWTVSIEILNITSGKGPLPFDIGIFSQVLLYAPTDTGRLVLANWYGNMDDLLDALVKFTDNPAQPGMVLEIRYVSLHEKLAGHLKATNGRYVTSTELRIGHHSEAYMELFKYLDVDTVKTWLPASSVDNSVECVTLIVDKILQDLLQTCPAEIWHNATALEAALVLAEDSCSNCPPDPLPASFVRAYQNVVDRINRIIHEVGYPLTSLKLTVAASYIFPTVGTRVLGAMRDSWLRTCNQTIGPLPVKDPPPSEFSDSFPI